MQITKLTEYNTKTAGQIRELLKQLSRSGKDKGEIPESWFRDVIASPWHELLIALDDSGNVIGFACLSVVMGPGIGKIAYLEDFVTDKNLRGQGVGSQLWDAMLDWARQKGCQELEFTSGSDRTSAHRFYLHHGAEIYDTSYFRLKINDN